MCDDYTEDSFACCTRSSLKSSTSSSLEPSTLVRSLERSTSSLAGAFLRTSLASGSPAGTPLELSPLKLSTPERSYVVVRRNPARRRALPERSYVVVRRNPARRRALPERYWNAPTSSFTGIPLAVEPCRNVTGTLLRHHSQEPPLAVELCRNVTGTLLRRRWRDYVRIFYSNITFLRNFEGKAELYRHFSYVAFPICCKTLATLAKPYLALNK